MRYSIDIISEFEHRNFVNMINFYHEELNELMNGNSNALSLIEKRKLRKRGILELSKHKKRGSSKFVLTTKAKQFL